MPKAVFFGLSGPTLTPEEIAFFQDVQPAGYILFSRNLVSLEQIRSLTDALRALSPGASLPILIDQEGGRVRRLRPPLAMEHPPVRPLGQLYESDRDAAIEAARLHGAAIAGELSALGINVDCLPVLDLLFPETHDIIGDRAFASDWQTVAALGGAVMEGLRSGGVIPVIKHIPGHGRAKADSHLELPIVSACQDSLAAHDFQPFAALNTAPMAMTAHILYEALDGERCATLSPMVIQDIIRGTIGFDGLLMTDDLSMKALGGSMTDRTTKAIDAGCDIILHCNGDMAEMAPIAAAAPDLAGPAQRRFDEAMAWCATQDEAIDVAQAVHRRDTLLEQIA